MSGILDSKRRVLDAIITQAGRSQMAMGDLQVKFASLSDVGTFYQADAISGSSDASNRIYFEACNLPQDNVTFEADDSGLLRPFKNGSKYDIINGKLVTWSKNSITGSTILTGSVVTSYIEGNEFSSTSDGLLTSSIDNFQKINVLSTYDTIFDDAQNFILSSNEVTWNITDIAPIDVNSSAKTIDLSLIDSIFNDPRCSKIKNFQKLSPINTKLTNKSDFVENLQLQQKKYHADMNSSIISDLQTYKSKGFAKVIDIVEPRPRKNNICCQMFEQHDNKLLKLDVIDYGVISTTDNERPTARVFFVGKILLDSFAAHTFVHMFTLVFD